MNFSPFVTDRQSADLAQEMIARYGEDAGQVAAARADTSRNAGNVLHFCRFRQVERLITLLLVDRVQGTLH